MKPLLIGVSKNRMLILEIPEQLNLLNETRVLGTALLMVQVAAVRAVFRAWHVNCLIAWMRICVYRCALVSFLCDKRSV